MKRMLTLTMIAGLLTTAGVGPSFAQLHKGYPDGYYTQQRNCIPHYDSAGAMKSCT
jgi:hypothetical protein